MDFDFLRKKMVEEQLIRRGIKNERVLAAFSKVPRHKFIPENLHDSAYGDFPLAIGEGQTISQPYMVAIMTEHLDPKKSEKILEIGTGSGYQAAILAELAGEVYSVERFDGLSKKAEMVLSELGYKNIHLKVDDGTLGWREFAPFDGIIITAGAPKVPNNLVGQLTDDGRMLIPIGGSFSQVLTLVKKQIGQITCKEICGCVFVPLVGKHGWQ
ncbi:MAG: protein-L-isoaspartate(D-aspartate) O-methyltransferase [Candidatus Omnitrophota bacterium]